MADLGIHAEAERELEEAFEYLEGERPGLGFQFLERYRQQVERAVRSPTTGTPALGFPKECNVRRFHMAQFPYALVVAMVHGCRVIVAVPTTNAGLAIGVTGSRSEAGACVNGIG